MQQKCGGQEGVINIDRNIDLSLLPPCRKDLLQHIRLANYQIAIWKRAHLPKPTVPKPTDGNGWTTINGIIQPLWFEGPVIPANIAAEDDTLESDDDASSDEEEQDVATLSDDILSDSDSEEESLYTLSDTR